MAAERTGQDSPAASPQERDAPARPVRGLADALVEFATLLTDEHSVGDILSAMARYCTTLLPVHGVGVLLRGPQGGLAVATANTDVGRVVEHLEAELGEGPCSTCSVSGVQVLEPDLAAAEPRYPRFVPRALEAGVRSIHALPLTARTEVVGALDIIALDDTALDAQHLATAQTLADVAVAYVANRRARDRADELARQLQHALDARVVIEQAKGMLAERHAETPTAAFERLRREARTSGSKVQDLAHAVLDGDLDL